MLKRIDFPQALLCLVVFAAMGFFLLYGPTEHRSAVAMAFLAFISTTTAALRGRMVKRDPEKAKAAEEKRRSSAPPALPSDSIPPSSN